MKVGSGNQTRASTGAAVEQKTAFSATICRTCCSTSSLARAAIRPRRFKSLAQQFIVSPMTMVIRLEQFGLVAAYLHRSG
jgi:hypothetical protein